MTNVMGKQSLVKSAGVVMLAIGLLLVQLRAAVADEIADFYTGKRLTIIVGSAGGTGSYDNYARLFARHIVNHLPGAPSTIVQNKPGAGSIAAINYVYNIAPQDGTVIVALNRTAPFTQILGHSSTQFDSAKLNWLGSLNEAIGVLTITAQSTVKTLGDARKTPVVIGATAPGTDSVIFPSLLNNTIGAKLKVIHGYNGMDNIFLAATRGEIEGQVSSLESLLRKIPDWRTKSRILVQFGLRKHAELPDVPLVFELLDEKQLEPGVTIAEATSFWQFVLTQTLMGQPFAMGPNVQTKRVMAMRTAFEAMVKDPRFLQEAEKTQLDIVPVEGSRIEELVGKAAAMPRHLLDKLQTKIEYVGDNNASTPKPRQ